MNRLPHAPSSSHDESSDRLIAERVQALCDAGWDIWERFSAGDLERPFHPFVPADYDAIRQVLWPYRRRGLRFLEWGSATGVITVMADMMGFQACGIELDSALSATATDLAHQFQSGARFARGSFFPEGYRWAAPDGDTRTGTLGTGPSGYVLLGHPLDEFDVVFGFPWDGESAMMFDIMARYGRPDAVLLINGASSGVTAYRGGRAIGDAPWFPKT